MEQVRQAAHQVRRMALRRRIAATAEDLHHARVAHAADRVHGFDHGQQRGTPGADADDVAGAHGGLKVVRGSCPQLAHRGRVVVARDLDDLGLGQREAGLQGLLQLRLRAARSAHRDAYDALVLGGLEQT